MAISKTGEEQIYKLIDTIVTLYISRASKDGSINSGNPFVQALLKDFDPLMHRLHGLKTSLGGEMEKIAEIIAIDAWGAEYVERKERKEISLPTNVYQTIDSIINELNNAKKLSNYKNEVEKVINACKTPAKDYAITTYEIDLQLFDKNKEAVYFVEMKGPDPNTTEVPGAKRRLLIELAWGFLNVPCKKVDTIFAIYYNNQFPKPYRNPKVLYYFDPDGGLLVHDKFWNFIGKDENTFTELVRIFEKYGKDNKKRIWSEFSKLISLPN